MRIIIQNIRHNTRRYMICKRVNRTQYYRFSVIIDCKYSFSDGSTPRCSNVRIKRRRYLFRVNIILYTICTYPPYVNYTIPLLWVNIYI